MTQKYGLESIDALRGVGRDIQDDTRQRIAALQAQKAALENHRYFTEAVEAEAEARAATAALTAENTRLRTLLTGTEEVYQIGSRSANLERTKCININNDLKWYY